MVDFIKKIIKETLSMEVEKPYLREKKGDLEVIKDVKSGVEKKLKKVYFDVTGEELDLPKIDIKIDDDIVDGKIAGFNHPKNGKNGLMGIKSKALDDKEYLKWVITHELIHASVGKDLPKSKEHTGLFKKIADKMGLPKEYQD
jgi:hypothetical protein